MPAHSIDVCYAHIAEAGITNAQRHLDEGALDLLKNELSHLSHVNRILTTFMLYYPLDPRWSDNEHDLYWTEYRLSYLAGADRKSSMRHCSGWELLALATRGHDFYDQIRREAEALYS